MCFKSKLKKKIRYDLTESNRTHVSNIYYQSFFFLFPGPLLASSLHPLRMGRPTFFLARPFEPAQLSPEAEEAI